MRTTKVSVTVDSELLAEARRYAPKNNLSSLFNEALKQRVKLERVREYLAEEARELGPLPDELRARVRAQWPG